MADFLETVKRIGAAANDAIRIIWANAVDPISHAPVGEHAAIVLNPQHEIDAGFDLDVYVCTTSVRNRQPGWFDVPTKPGGHEITGLDQACVAKATWHNLIPQNEVIRGVGRAPSSLFKQLRNWLADKARLLLRPAEPPDADERIGNGSGTGHQRKGGRYAAPVAGPSLPIRATKRWLSRQRGQAELFQELIVFGGGLPDCYV